MGREQRVNTMKLEMFGTLRPLFPYLRRYRWRLAVGFLTVIFNNGTWVLFPLVLGNAVSGLEHGVTREKLVTYSLQLVAVAVVKGIFQFLTRWIVIGVSREIEFDIRSDLFAHLETLSGSYYQRHRTGDIMARATNDLNAVRMLLGPAIMYSANAIVFTAGALYFMTRISPSLTFWAFLPLPLVSILLQQFGKRIHDRFEKIQATFSDVSVKAQENFSGARLIRAYNQEKASAESFEFANQEYIKRSLRLVLLMGMLWPTLQLMLGLSLVVVLLLGGHDVLNGTMQLPNFVAYNAYLLQLTFPIIALGWVINMYQRGTASAGRIHEIMAAPAEIADDPALVTVAEDAGLRGEIEFRNLNFAYPNADGSPGTAVLKDVNLTIPAGGSLAIVGPTGSGKSTLIHLIPRTLDAAAGMVLIDGRPIRQYSLQTLRRNMGIVPQETFLFSDTIANNIAFGVENATEEQIRDAAEAAGVAKDIESFPAGYQTTVGERGLTLSGGQKQRTAIARAVIRNPRILILDDALASVDTQTEEHILSHLRELMQGRTTIFISHRVSTVRNADRIAVLHGGQIVECGTHEELLVLGGYYTDLYNKQLLEEELTAG
jgi:ATP-binding cassette subfamily B protein